MKNLVFLVALLLTFLGVTSNAFAQGGEGPHREPKPSPPKNLSKYYEYDSSYSSPYAFEHDGLQGARLSLRSDRANLKDLSWNDKISSFSIPEGWEITFYKDVGYKGDTFTKTGPVTYYKLKPFGWNDEASSIRVYKLK